MNRKHKRAAAANKHPVDRLTAFHEAGHAVGRYLSAGEMGIPMAHAVSHIDLPTPDNGMIIAATTYGPMFPPNIDQTIYELTEGNGIPSDPKVMRSLIDQIGDGFDRRAWLIGRARLITGGAAAEGFVQGRPGADLLVEEACEHDATNIRRDAYMVDREDELAGLVNSAFSWWDDRLQNNQATGDALSAVAEQIMRLRRRPFKIPGHQIIKTIEKAGAGGLFT